MKSFENQQSEDIRIKLEKIIEDKIINDNEELHEDKEIFEKEKKFNPLGFQISSVAGGVNMIENCEIKKEQFEEINDYVPYTEINTEKTQHILHLNEVNDIKPTREKLDSFLKISNISSNITIPIDLNESINSRKYKTNSKLQSHKDFMLPQISSVFSRESNSDQANQLSEFLNLEIKKEKNDPSYKDYEASIEKTEQQTSFKQNNYTEEQSYIANIDFNNIHVKEEIEFNDETYTQTNDDNSNCSSSNEEDDHDERVEGEEEKEESDREYREIEMISNEDGMNLSENKNDIQNDCKTNELNFVSAVDQNHKQSNNCTNLSKEQMINNEFPQDENNIFNPFEKHTKSTTTASSQNNIEMPTKSSKKSFEGCNNTNIFKSNNLENSVTVNSNDESNSISGLIIVPSSVCSLAKPFSNETEEIPQENQFTICDEEIENNLNQELVLNQESAIDIERNITDTDTATVKILNEETENLLNESVDAANKFQTNNITRSTFAVVVTNSPVTNTIISDNFNDHINEIAENNNNDNIEREFENENRSLEGDNNDATSPSVCSVSIET